MLETKNMDLGPWSNNQFNRLFRDYAPINGYADVTSTTAGAEYFCYGSVLDNGSNDPTTVLPAVRPTDLNQGRGFGPAFFFEPAARKEVAEVVSDRGSGGCGSDQRPGQPCSKALGDSEL